MQLLAYNCYLWPATINYSSIVLCNPHDNVPSVLKFPKENIGKARELIDLIAYSLHVPVFLETNNKILDRYASFLYECPIFEEFGRTDVRVWLPDEIFIKEDLSKNNADILSLYNTALKQPEPLARCVFLYRVYEYFYNHIINYECKPSIIDSIKNNYSNSLAHKYIPILIQKDIYNLEVSYAGPMQTNLISKWKIASKYLIDKKNEKDPDFHLGSFVYEVGRCGSAHGGDSRNKILRQEDPEDYKTVKSINLILDLIIRYLVEKHIPQTAELRSLNDKRFR